MKVFLLITFCLLICGYALARDSLKVYSIDQIGIQTGDTFEDLRGIGKAIRGKQIVSILDFGEGGSGTSYEALGRIVKYLHEELGFEILIWPIGMYEGLRMQQELESEDVGSAASYLYRVWRESSAMQALLEYASEKVQTDKIENLGLGCEFHLQAKEQWAKELQEWLDSNRVAEPAVRSLRILLEIWNKQKRLKLLDKKDLDLLEKLNDQILAAVNWKPIERQLLTNMKWFVQLERIRAFSPKEQVVENVHNFTVEKQAHNWEWLQKQGIEGKKVITLGFPGWLEEQYQNQVYTIGLTAYQGELARPGQTIKAISPIGEEYWEWQLQQYGEPYLFVDISKARKPKLQTRLADAPGVDHLNALFFMSASLPNQPGDR